MMTTEYRVAELSTFPWQQQVLNTLAVPVGNEPRGARYLIASGSGVFAGLDGSIATANDPDDTPTLLADWIIDTSTEGMILYNATANKYYYCTAPGTWAEASGITSGHSQNTDTGTTSATFQLNSGASGFKLKDNSGVAEIKNAADNAYANIKAADVVATGNITDGTYATSPAHIKDAYDNRAIYDSELKCLTFTL
jgi:hypothetical protein